MSSRRLLAFVLAALPTSYALSARAIPQPAPEPATAASAAPTESTSVAPPPVAPPPAPAPVAVAPKPAPEVAPHPSEVVDVAPKPAPQTDHDKVVGHFGIGYFGQYDMPLGFTNLRSAGATEAAQIVGLRYWWPRVRLDVGFGWNMGSGSQEIAGKSTDGLSTLVLVGRVSLPIALYSDDHYTFFIGPDVAYGQGGETVPSVAPTVPGATQQADTSHKGSRFTLGGRAGAEIQFGFIGLPRLALDASVSLALNVISGSTTGPDRSVAPTPGSPAPTVESKYNRTLVHSSAEHQPWNIFVSNVAAVYYF